MYNHETEHYDCPFCALATGHDTDQKRSLQSDVVYRDEAIITFIARDWWPNNPGHVLIAPIAHHENLYDLPDDVSIKIHMLEKKVACALKVIHRCDGVSSRQHNEPDGGQDVWHYHLAVFPRYKNDELYLNTYKRSFAEPDKREPYAQKLKAYLSQNG